MFKVERSKVVTNKYGRILKSYSASIECSTLEEAIITAKIWEKYYKKYSINVYDLYWTPDDLSFDDVEEDIGVWWVCGYERSILLFNEHYPDLKTLKSLLKKWI